MYGLKIQEQKKDNKINLHFNTIKLTGVYGQRATQLPCSNFWYAFFMFYKCLVVVLGWARMKEKKVKKPRVYFVFIFISFLVAFWDHTR